MSYSDVFNEPIDVLIVVKKIPQKAAIEFVCQMLHLFNVRERNNLQFQFRQLVEWMLKLNRADQSQLLFFVSENENAVQDARFVLLSRRAGLDLIQHLLLYGDSQNGMDLDRDDYSALFRILLTFNAKENVIQQKLFHWDGTGSFDDFANGIMTVQIRNIEIERFKYYHLQFLKAHYFFNFCESDQKYAAYLAIFLKNQGFLNYKAYLSVLFKTYYDLMTSTHPYIEISAQSNAFFERMVINNKNPHLDADYKYFRSYPLFKTRANTFLVLDARFLIDKVYWGCLFDFSSAVGISFPDLKKDLGRDFSETILFYAIMKLCFSGYGDVNKNGTELKLILGQSEPDFYIRQGKDVFLFEFKDLLIPANVKYVNDSEKIKKGILEKLEQNQDGKRKGIRQLLHCVKEINNEIYYRKGVDMLNGDQISIYPIIVHTDVSLESFGVNYFLNERMHQIAQQELIDLKRVKDLILINLDTFIHLQDHFGNGKLVLSECLKVYQGYISSGDPLTDTVPFDEFLKHHVFHQHNIQIGAPQAIYAMVDDFIGNDV